MQLIFQTSGESLYCAERCERLNEKAGNAHCGDTRIVSTGGTRALKKSWKSSRIDGTRWL